MSKKNNLIILISLVLIFSCNSSDDLTIKKEYFSSGNIKSEQLLFQDSIRHGEYKIYFENGIVAQEGSYDMGKIEGEVIYYYETGEVESKVSFEKDEYNGISNSYYRSGNIEIKANYVNGKKQGEYELFYENGRIKSYMYFVENEGYMYRRDYNKNGKLTKEGGFAFPENVVVNDVNFKVGDVFEAEFRVINPPDCSVLLRLGELNTAGRIINSEVFELEDDNSFLYKKVLKKKGVIKVVAFLEMDCESLIDRKAKTISVDITVN